MASKRRWRKPVIVSGAVLAILYVAICAYMYFEQESFLFHPTVVKADYEWDLKLENEQGLEDSVEELSLPSALDGMVNALHFKLDSSKGAVLYIHGNGGNVAECGRNRNLFLRNGWEFFIMDYRGYGKSTGEISQDGLDADVEAAWAYLNKIYPPEKMIIYGQSMGSGYATRLAAKHVSHLLILEAPYTSLVDVAQGNYPWLPVRWMFNFPSPSLEYVDDVACPVYIFHGDQDDVIPYQHGVAMSKAAKHGKLFTLPGHGHLKIQLLPRVGEVLDSILH